ncbi:MerR family transcriptional regulator [Pseudophaeobacter sp. TrK17]|uniref:MerR family transcriptional regulator n=1 Tax=Pseudophaeobacter sp. TrK17 TaxID=2815167 RepID=UPI0035D11050
MSKSADAFRTISEVADWLGVQAHVLRFWESKFTQIKPVKRAGGRRYYRPADMLLLGGIRKLMHKDGLSIKEVQAILRDLGIAHVSQLSHDLESDGPPSDNVLADSPPLPKGAARTGASAPDPQYAISSSPVKEETDEDTARKYQKPPGLSDKKSVASASPTAVEPPLTRTVDPGTGTPPLADETFDTLESESSHAAEQDSDLAAGAEAAAPAADSPSEFGGELLPQTDPVEQDPSPEVDLVPPTAELVDSEPEQMHMELDGPAELARAAQIQTPTTPPQPDTPAVDMPPADDMPSADMTPVDTAAADPVPTDTVPTATVPADTAPNAAAPAEPAPLESTAPAPEPQEPENHSAAVAADHSQAQPLEDPAQPPLPPLEQSEPTQAGDTAQQPEPIAAHSVQAGPVLSLLAQTSRLPAHVTADVANCAAELRAILAAG